ncbi:MAG: hypothetical protein ACM3QZ_13585 [Solirubrobacterales bacterium]
MFRNYARIVIVLLAGSLVLLALAGCGEKTVTNMSFAGGSYTGEVMDNQGPTITIDGIKYKTFPNGNGILVFPSGMRCDGTWEMGQFISPHRTDFGAIASSAPPDQAAGKSPSPPTTLSGQAWADVKTYLHQYDKCGFSKAISLGKESTYRSALVDVEVKVDSKLKSVALYDPNKKELTLSKSPDKPQADVNESIWHELTHRIEDNNGDIGAFDSDAYAERNIDYMTRVTDSLNVLEMMEKQARKGGDPEQVKKKWDAFVRRVDEAKAANPENPVNIQKLQEWSGFDVDPEKIKEVYRSGQAGPELQAIFQ